MIDQPNASSPRWRRCWRDEVAGGATGATVLAAGLLGEFRSVRRRGVWRRGRGEMRVRRCVLVALAPVLPIGYFAWAMVVFARSWKNRLKVLRAERDWSQAALAQRLGVSRQTVNAIERGKYYPSLPLAFRMARLFDQPIHAIFEPEEDGR